MAVALFTEDAFPDPISSSPRYKPSLSLFFSYPQLPFSFRLLLLACVSSLSFAAPYIPLTLSTTTLFLAMVRILCIASLALAAVSAVSGHILRHRQNPPKGWETDILQVHSPLAVYVKSSFSASLAAISHIPLSLLVVGLSE